MRSFRLLRPRALGALVVCLLNVLSTAATAEESSSSAGPRVTAPQTQSPPPNLQLYNGYEYARPHWYTLIVRIPGDYKESWYRTARRENLWPIAFIAVSTGLLIWKDQWLVDRAHEAGDKLHISHTNHQKSVASVNVFGQKLALQGPYDSGSALYFLGDGFVDLWIAGGFAIRGWAGDNNRALQTASEIGESVLTSGGVVQLLKHVTGRESPYVATQSGGRWVPFPNQIDYHKNVPHYDAMPSGHLAAGMATLTVVAENYPEYHFIRPLGYTLLTALGFQMMNNGVHWASDYPLGLALGYGFGRIAVDGGRRRANGAPASTVRILPDISPDHIGLVVRKKIS